MCGLLSIYTRSTHTFIQTQNRDKCAIMTIKYKWKLYANDGAVSKSRPLIPQRSHMSSWTVAMDAHSTHTHMYDFFNALVWFDDCNAICKHRTTTAYYDCCRRCCLMYIMHSSCKIDFTDDHCEKLSYKLKNVAKMEETSVRKMWFFKYALHQALLSSLYLAVFHCMLVLCPFDCSFLFLSFFISHLARNRATMYTRTLNTMWQKHSNACYAFFYDVFYNLHSKRLSSLPESWNVFTDRQAHIHHPNAVSNLIM